MSEPTGRFELTKLENDLLAALAVILDQIDSCGPTEMIGAAFDGRELETARELVKATYNRGASRGTPRKEEA